MNPDSDDSVVRYYYNALHPHRDQVSEATVRAISEALAAKAKRIQHINGLPPTSDSLRMSFGEVNKKGIKNITAYVIRGARQTRVEWVNVRGGGNVVEAFGKKIRDF
ncbi:hypothetical protein SLS60_007129 [Paraconiothyrium brasiliense]|uniref:Uncharacterized protein n=1 Tax=Paraconiothyrium brasiliense TaxID=300254 RepID=A0ABR3R8K5_9PLEO